MSRHIDTRDLPRDKHEVGEDEPDSKDQSTRKTEKTEKAEEEA